MFKKTCFSCGAKVDKVYEGICVNCLKQQQPPIQELKPINFKFCNFTKKISYKNYYYEQEELEQILPDIVKKYLIINPNYKLENVDIENFEIDGHKIRFDVIAECELVE